MTMRGQNARTGTDNPTYDLTSVLYHALQGAETTNQYLQDAEGSGDQDLAEFFREVCDQQNAQAERAKKLLASRLS
jgi:hypothetical protein